MKILKYIVLLYILLFTPVAESAQLDKYGGLESLQGEKTGFFHTQNINGRWWIITPDGNVFWSTGVYCVRFGGLPENDTGKRLYKDACQEKYGSEGEWARVTKIQLKGWGFNSIGDWSAESTYKEGLDRKNGLAYVIGIDMPKKAENVIPKGSWGYFPDVFSQEFADSAKAAVAKKMTQQPYLIADPWLLGYFLADEPAWYGSKQRYGAIVDDFINLDASKPGKYAWVKFIQDRYPSIAEVNKAWGTSFNSFEDLSSVTKLADTPTTQKDKLAFLEVIAETFAKTLHDALREVDKNHMVLGTRPTRFYPEVVKGLGKYCDIFGTSAYGLNKGYVIDPEFEKIIGDVSKHSGKPIMLGVLIAAQDSGYSYGTVKTQKDRGVSYWRYLAKVASNPAVVGIHWFQYFDPPKNCYDKRASNWGLVNEKDEPYTEGVNLIAQGNKMVYAYALGLSDFSPEFDTLFGVKKDIPQTHTDSGGTINLPILNAGFEEGKVSWQFQTWKGKSKVLIDPSVSHSGKMSLKIEGGPEEGWGSVGVGMQNNPQFALKPGYSYKLSAWIKTKDVENTAFVRIKTKYKSGESAYFVTDGTFGTADWKHVETTFVPIDNNAVDYIGAQLVGKGIVWFDDIRLEVTPSAGETAENFAASKKEKTTTTEDSRKVRQVVLLSNSDFENGEKDWKFQAWKGRPKITVDEKTAHTGNSSVKIMGSADGWDSVGVAVKNDATLKLEPQIEYRLKGWIKTNSVEDKAMIRIKVIYEDGKSGYFETRPVAGTNDWMEVTVEFKPKKKNNVNYLACEVVGKGTAWFDDISLEELK